MGYEILILPALLGLIPIIGYLRKEKIREKIASLGGEVISIERRNIFTGIGPFKIVGKGRVVYRIEYRLNGSTEEGWVRFGGLLGPDWRL
ncbi:hypothetical protein RH915_08965 [Serpentinicella sp. ANB-PHB4]|uniref:hypothetical protein n=1 Tax=Serpentinicella sp. ANB-PHB4 TaxID=3074076 RepID=UPI00285C12D8|nr:hypothetical protein [Serpentinicella sp. ANB-PHB4]MDR5659624.1 hypothetical protein [Serpentinicella sp. ANB-PHB4]